MPLDQELDPDKYKTNITADGYMRELLPCVKLLYKIVAENVKENQVQYKERYDRKATPTDYQPGTLVWLYEPPRTEKGKCKKMQIRYNKLVYVKEKCPGNTYKVIDNSTHKELAHAVHSDRLKAYHPELDHFPDKITVGPRILEEDNPDQDEEGSRGKQCQCLDESQP